jgi:hypothetical protein
MTNRTLEKSTKPIIQPSKLEIKHFIFFLWSIFACICLHEFEWPIPLHGTVFKIYSSNELPDKRLLNPEPRGSLVKIACLVSPHLIKYIDQRQVVSFQADALGNIQKNKSLGTIVSIKGIPIQNQNNIHYIVECEINDTEILLTNGYKAKFVQGMKLNGHLYLNRKKIIEFLLDQLDQWFCPSTLRGT